MIFTNMESMRDTDDIKESSIVEQCFIGAIQMVIAFFSNYIHLTILEDYLV